jgi:hypothetical protein
MEVLDLNELSDEGAFFEDAFEQKLSSFNWERYADKTVRITSCGLINVPGWVYLQVGIELSKRASKIFYGDAKNPKRIYRREVPKGRNNLHS